MGHRFDPCRAGQFTISGDLGHFLKPACLLVLRVFYCLNGYREVSEQTIELLVNLLKKRMPADYEVCRSLIDIFAKVWRPGQVMQTGSVGSISLGFA